MRIVSLLPSATEIVCELGLRDQLVGVTHECDFPPGISSLPHVTRTFLSASATSAEIDQQVRQQLSTQQSLYQLDHNQLAALEPDLIITQSLCDVCAVAESDVREALCRLPRGAQLLNLEPQSLSEVLETLETVANASGVEAKGKQARLRLQNRIDAVRGSVAQAIGRPRVLILEWIDPPFSAGHWVPEIVDLAGGHEMIGKPGERSVTLAWNDVVAAQPDVLFISCCGFSIERTTDDLPILFEQLGSAKLPCIENKQVFVLDGSAYLSRPGPRLVDALELIAWTLHPNDVKQPAETRGIQTTAIS